MKRKDILVILIPSFIFAVLWIIFSIHHALNTPTISQAESIQITPISPNFDTKIFEELKKRENITPIYELTGSSKSIPTSLQPPLTSINSSASANQASSGGSLLP